MLACDSLGKLDSFKLILLDFVGSVWNVYIEL